MTTLTRGTPPSVKGGSEGWGSEREDSRWAQWWASWRVAIRMGRRDVRRHRGRSALIIVMVFLPVATVVGGVVVLSSQEVSGQEALPLLLGGSTAAIALSDDGAQAVPSQVCEIAAGDPRPDGSGPSCARRFESTPATPLAGLTPGHEAQALAALTGADVARVTSSVEQVVLGTRHVSVDTLGADVPVHPAVRGRATLISGHWPTSVNEVVVTEAGIHQGLPTSGALTGLVRGPSAKSASTGSSPPLTERQLTIVGIGSGYTGGVIGLYPKPADLITLPDALGPLPSLPRSLVGPASVDYLMTRSTALTDSEISALNVHGFVVADTRLVSEGGMNGFGGTDDTHGGTFAAYTALAAVGLLLLTSLLAGPAFAISAARQRRALALLASNGATTPQVRRTVLAQALVLGVLAALIGGVVGVSGSWILLSRLRAFDPTQWWGPFDVPALPLLIAVGSAVLSALAAGLAPARGLGRLDVVRVMRGQEVSPKVHRGLPVIGMALVASGTAVLWWGLLESTDTSTPLPTVLISAGILLLVGGALLVIPVTLVLLGRLTRQLPVTVRMATRDASRQRGRATPTVAAVMAASAVLTTLLVIVASTSDHDRRAYQPRIPTGTATLSADPAGGDPGGESVSAQLRSVATAAAPGLLSGMTWSVGDGMPPGFSSTPLVAALRTGCTPTDVTAQPFSQPQCLSISSWPTATHVGILAADPAYLARVLDLTTTERDAVDQGSMLVVDGPGAPPRTIETRDGGGIGVNGDAAVDVVGGRVTMATLVVTSDAGTGTPRIVGSPTTRTVPAQAIERARVDAFGGASPGAVVSTAKARSLGWPLTYAHTVAWAPSGAITPESGTAIQHALDRDLPGATLEVERGWTGSETLNLVNLVAIAAVGFLVLVATLIATALSQAETLTMMSTLAAVGATRGTRRRIAAAQAGYLALAGVVLGILVGLVPGVSAAHVSTTPRPGEIPAVPATVVVPWLPLLVLLVVIPLVAAALAWLSIRRSPAVTRRLT